MWQISILNEILFSHVFIFPSFLLFPIHFFLYFFFFFLFVTMVCPLTHSLVILSLSSLFSSPISLLNLTLFGFYRVDFGWNQKGRKGGRTGWFQARVLVLKWGMYVCLVVLLSWNRRLGKMNSRFRKRRRERKWEWKCGCVYMCIRSVFVAGIEVGGARVWVVAVLCVLLCMFVVLLCFVRVI